MKCSIVGCSETVVARSLCNGHYGRWRKGTDLNSPLKPVRGKRRPLPGQPKPCLGCEQQKPLAAFGKKHRTYDGLQSICKSCEKVRRDLIIDHLRKEHRAYYARIKKETLQAYGGWCACCSEGRQQFLCIDHIKGGGNEERRRWNTKGGTKFYLILRRQGFPPGYQVLCYNCNMATVGGKLCPHTKE